MATSSTFTLTGHIFDEFNTPIVNAIVQAYDKDLNTEQLLGVAALTDSSGFYNITFNALQATAAELKTPDAFIRVSDRTGKPLGQSAISFNISSPAVIDFKTGNTKIKSLNEFDTLVQLLQPLVVAAKLEFKDLTEKEQHISFLAGETEEDITHIDFVVKAFQMAEAANKLLSQLDTSPTHAAIIEILPPAIFYAWLRNGFSSDLNVLLRTPAESLRQTLLQAIETNIVSGRLTSSVDRILAVFTQLLAHTIMESNDTTSEAFKKTVGEALPTPELQRVFLEEYISNQPTRDKLWANLALRQGFKDGKAIAATKSIMQLSVFTGNQPELTTALYKEQQRDSELTDLRGFAKYDKADWKQLIMSTGVKDFPNGITGSTTEEKIEQYSSSLDNLVKTLYPTNVFAQRLKKDTSMHWGDTKNDLTSFFSRNPDFDLKTNKINKHFAEAKFDEVTNKENLKKELKAVNRLYKLSDDFSHVSALRSEGIVAATDMVIKYSRPAFAAKFASTFGSLEEASKVYKKAQQVNKKISAVLINYQLSNDIQPHVMKVVDNETEGGNAERSVDAAADGSETYKELFGSNGLCDCEHCQSVYSPSAYFVDILKYIRDEGKIEDTDSSEYISKTFALLNSRRPDLVHIKLTCENANTPVPYIDLVNELLENKVAGTEEVFQTEGEAEEIAAIPEHINSSAYYQLKSVTGAAVVSSFLPLDLPLEEMRIYADKLGYKRNELMELFYGNNQPGKDKDLLIAAELLQLSSGEVALFNGATAVAMSLPATIAELLQTTGLTYVELSQLLETNFLNPKPNGSAERILSIISTDNENPATCVLEDLILKGGDNAWMNKMILFVRLWKKLGWDIFDLDRCFTAFDIKSFDHFDEKILLPVSHVVRVQQQLHLPIRQIITFWGDIDRKVYHDHSKEGQPRMTSLYQELFRNKAVKDPLDPDFEDSNHLPGLLLDHADAITAPLRITRTDLELLAQQSELLSLGALSRIYRYFLLANSLKVSINDLLNLVALTGMQPFNGAENTDTTIEFINKVKASKSFGFSIAELNYLLRHEFSTACPLPNSQEIAVSLFQLREGLRKLNGEASNDNYPTKAAFFVADKLAPAMHLDASITFLLLTKILSVPGTTTGDKLISTFIADSFVLSTQALTIDKANEITNDFPTLVSVWIFLNKTAYILNKLKLEAEEVDWLYLNSEQTGTTALWHLPSDSSNPVLLASIENLFYLLQFRKTNAESNYKWFELIEIVIKNEPLAKKNFIERLAQANSFEEPSLIFLLGTKEAISNKGKLNASFPADCLDAEFLMNLLSCSKAIEKLGNNTDSVNALTAKRVTAIDAQVAKNLLKAKYNNSEWLKIIKPISDQLRVKKRDALVAYLLASPGNSFTDSNAIFESLLIDVQMDACMMTSRIKQAISSVQLFIDRCLMGLETNISLGESLATQWRTWRERYRVWEANRKIFLYPENWIEPGLRDDKSLFFKELESKLLQNEITKESVEDAIREYLEKLDEVSKLEIVGMWQEDADPDDDETGFKNIIHVFGRTKEIPRKYYYRKQKNSLEGIGIWTAWEKVDLDIEGDHIIPVVLNKRPMLYWAIFAEKQDNSTNTRVPASHDPMPGASKYWEVKMAFSEYKKGKWCTKKITKEKKLDWQYSLIDIKKEDIVIRLLPGDAPQFKFYHASNNFLEDGTLFFEQDEAIQVVVNPNRTARMIIRSEEPHHVSEKTDFDRLMEIGSGLQGYQIGFCSSTGTYFDRMRIVGRNNNALALHKNGLIVNRPDLDLLPSEQDQIFLKTPGLFEITPPAVEIEAISLEPFAYSDSKGIFLVSTQRELLTLSSSFDGGPVSFYQKLYKFKSLTFYYADKLIRVLNTKGIDGIFEKNIQNTPDEILFSDTAYGTLQPLLIDQPYPVKNYDFSIEGSFSIYYWELFFHIPLLIACRLSQDQKFEAARHWFHYIFNPTISSDETSAKKFWITKPFLEELGRGILTLTEILDEEKNPDLKNQTNYWENNPFNPHAVARMRTAAYMRNVLMKYVDNLIAWGDQLFRKDTLETINEATLMYVLAGNILGKRPEKVPPRASVKKYSFDGLMHLDPQEIDPFSNIKAEIESYFSTSGPPDVSADNNELMPLFCIPKNDQLLSYWDTVADRLFKIRHCENIEGVFRHLALFEPPIDPGLLVRAAAAGVDIASVIGQGNQSLPNYRFNVMLSKANEFCSDVKVLGNTMLAALEKKDAEQLALLRSGHELIVLQAMRDIKRSQRDEAEENLGSLTNSRDVIQARRDYYSSRQFRNPAEQTYFSLTQSANVIQSALELNGALASASYLIPQTNLGPWIMGVQEGGINLGNATMAALTGGQSLASSLKTAGELANIIGTFQRRKEDWDFQTQIADLELKQTEKQIIAAEIRLAIAERDLEIHEQQIENASEVDDFMRGKFTNAELYDWMVGQVATVYFQSYQLAYDIAKKAEKCFQYELGIENTNYVQFGYWDSLKKGLLSGEKLQYDLRRLENGYLEENKREYEITKHISTVLINPPAFLRLKETGKCDINLPEELFDLDFPGHYFRRIKSVSISIPCITGPYSSVNATLRLTGNEYRIDKSAELYNKTSEEISTPGTGRFRSSIGSFSSIATSNAQNDSGVFELNFRDERYLPFEGAGVISSWSLELPDPKLAQFDYNTMSDVIMHIKYTSREGGVDLKNVVSEGLLLQINEMIVSSEERGLMRLFSLKNDFPDEFYKMKTDPTTGEVSKGLKIGKTFFPYFANNCQISFKNCSFYAKDGAVIFPEQIKSNNAVAETIDDNWSLSLNYNSTYFKEQGDIYMLLNYSLANL